MKRKQKLYIIKSLAPWMMEELIAFSHFEKFKIIFLRNIPEFYRNDMEILKKNGIEYHVKPFKFKFNVKLFILLKLLAIKNLNKFLGKQNFIWTLNSMYWFLILDKNILKNIQSIHAQFASQAAIVSFLIHKFYKIDYYFTFHAHDIYFNNRWFTGLVNNSINSFSISEFNIHYVKNHFKNLKSEKIKLSRLGVALPEKQKSKKYPVKKVKIGFISNLEEKKGIPYLLAAFLELHRNNPDKYLLSIAGDGDYMQMIKDFVQKNNLKEQVNILGKIRDQKKIDFYMQTDIFVLPSIRTKDDMDGIPVVLMEAIAYGIPIISTNISGIPEICINEYNGFLINEKNSEQIVNAVENLSSSERIYVQCSKNSLHLAQKEYNLVKNSKQKMSMMNWIEN
ncbi:MAG: glycosyltransferase family 4 protein [Bacteroidales bacterium]|nr:glycosyltransferase family 4 protein [Bacteroidales bacterium]